MHALLLVLPLLAAEPAAAPRLAVLVTGPSALESGRLQRELEAGLAARKIEPKVIPVAELGTLLAGIPASAGVPRAFEDEWEAARKAGVNANWKGARAALDRAEKALGSVALRPAFEEARLHLMRAFIERKGSNDAAARAFVEKAAAAYPGLEVNLDVFPPSFREFLDREKARYPKPAVFSVEDLAPGAVIEIHGLSHTRHTYLRPGEEHAVTIRAPGLRPQTQHLAVHANMAYRIRHAPIAKFDGWPAPGDDVSALTKLSGQLGADLLALVSHDEDGALAGLFDRRSQTLVWKSRVTAGPDCTSVGGPLADGFAEALRARKP